MNNMKKNKKISFSFITKLANTIIYTLVIFCIMLVILYIVGNYQDFQDKSQQIILTTISYTSIGTIFLTLPVLVENFIRVFTTKNKKESISTILLMLFIVIVMIFCTSFSSILEYLSKGI